MLFWFSARRLALLVAGVFIIAILSLRKTTHDDVLPSSHKLGLSQSHNGKGRPAAPFHKVLEQSGVDGLHGGHDEFGSAINAIQRPRSSPLPHDTHEQIQTKIHKLRAHWAPPTIDNHYPPYNKYGDADYDPNLWEGFEWDHDFYIRNGIKRLNKEKPYAAKLVPYLPYPDYNTAEWKLQWHGEYVPCEGARGKLLNESKEDWVMAYSALPDGFPEPAVGDSAVTGIDVNRCFDRYNRLGPYGYGQNIKNRVQDWSRPGVKPNWTEVPWGSLQDQCLRSNQGRYISGAREPVALNYKTAAPNITGPLSLVDSGTHNAPRYHHRTAVLIRTWGNYQYTENDLESIRSLITELNLLSGGEYQVFLFVHIKNNNLDLTDAQLRQMLLDKHVPREFHSISILWNEKILEQWYPRVGDWQVYWHQFMPLQWFSKVLPQFDFVWNWEMDARYTGNHYHFLEQVSSFARAAPRKYLWERNQRFYFPAAHGSYEQWLADTDASIEAAAKNGSMKVVWGPQPYNTTYQTPIGPQAPHSMEKDDYEWGVGEEADLITLQPIWDPVHTDWVYRDKIFNFLPGIRPQFSPQDPLDKYFTHPDFANIPRRTYINTVSRFSKRQLHAMHMENTIGRTMQAEMWPATAALHHGLKTVYAPHPIWTDRKWPGWYMDAVFNSDGKEHARWGARKDSVYSQDREHNFAGWSWYYNADFPKILYRRWLGWPAHVGSEEQYPDHPLRVLGGIQFEDKGMKVELPAMADGNLGFSTGAGNEVKIGGQGRMCLPPMLLHPVKKMFEPEGHMASASQDEINAGRLSRAWMWLMDRFD
jgi:hypothetical protein